MSELKLGKMTTQELADWFCTSKNNFSKHKTTFMQKLRDYCEFEAIYGGVIVSKISKYVYVKNPNYQIVVDNIENTWSETGLDTCAHVGEQIYEKHKDQLKVKVETTQRHTAQARNEKWGNPKEEDSKCYYMLCKKDAAGTPIFLSEKEIEIKERLLQKWFGTADEKTVIVQSMIDNQEITSEEAWETYSKLMRLPKSYIGFMNEFKRETGIQLIRGTYVKQECGPAAWDVVTEGGFDF